MNKKLLSFLFLVFVSMVSFYACKRGEEKPKVDETSVYIPLQIGKYITYNVDSTLWFDTLCVTHNRHYQLMYMVADTFRDDQGRLSYRIDTRVRKKAEDPWMTQDVIYVTKTDVNLEWSQNGLTMIKMIFPIRENATWSGNAHIPVNDADLKYFDGWVYNYSDVSGSFNAGEVIYPNTVTVNQVDRVENNPETLPDLHASRTYGKEVFAEGIGMVYREYIRWTYDPVAFFNNDPNQPNRCRRGWSVVMSAVDHN